MAADMRAGTVQGIQEPDCVDLGHALCDLFGREPVDGCGLVGGAFGAAGGLAAEDQGDDAAGGVLVDPGELVDLDVDAGLFPDLAPDAVLGGLVQFQDSAGELPSAVVRAADRQEAGRPREPRLQLRIPSAALASVWAPAIYSCTGA